MQLDTPFFEIKGLDVERLLEQWRWLCPGPMVLVARNGFGDLFLRTNDGRVLRLDVTGGNLTWVADSESQFSELLNQPEARAEWFAEAELAGAAKLGLRPNSLQCIGFKTPLVFAESAARADNAYVADLYEQVSSLGDLHRQIASERNGEKIKLRVGTTQ